MKRRSKILAVVLAVLLIACLLPTAAFAAETPSGSVAIGSFTGGTVTINASNADDSFALYKVIDITYNAATNEVNYAFTTAAAAYNATLGAAAPSLAAYQSWSDDSAELKEYLGGFAAYVKVNGVAASYSGSAVSGVCTIENVALGQYLVLGTGSSTGAYVYQLMTATFKPDASYNVNTGVTLSSKSSQPTITKSASDRQVAYGDTVTYTVVVAIPTYPAGATNKTFTVTDVLPAGVTYTDGSASVKVSAPSTADKTLSTAPTADGSKLTWAFNFSDLEGYTTLTITYAVTANTSGSLIPVTTGAENTATLQYSNDPYGTGTHEISDTETVYTYGLSVTKKGEAEGSGEAPVLEGVEFKLYKGTVSESNLVGTYTTNASGQITVDGLDIGTYVLVETKTVNGYVLPADPNTTITIADDDADGKLNSTTSGYYASEITNTKGEYTLPQTGGIGTWVFTIGGLALMAAAVVCLLVFRKKSAKGSK